MPSFHTFAVFSRTGPRLQIIVCGTEAKVFYSRRSLRVVNKVIYEMNWRRLLLSTDYDISVAEKETSEPTEKKPENPRENLYDLPTKTEKVQRVRKEAANKKIVNLN